MDSLHTGSDELVFVQTEKISVTIKGRAAHPNFPNVDYADGDSVLKVFCDDDYDLSIKELACPIRNVIMSSVRSGIYTVTPMFFEQQQYELIIEAVDGIKVSFWHDNARIREKITRASKRHEILSGIINFGSEVGLSDLVVQINSVNYLRLVIEVFPSKISYKDDYKSIMTDVTKEVSNIVFDFLKRTYFEYQQSDHTNSNPVVFFAVIRKIFNDLLKATDMILTRPHHILEISHETLPSHKVKRIDHQTTRWLAKHPEQAIVINDTVAIARAMTVKKQVTYDTKENQLTKFILRSTVNKLESFIRNYLRLAREEDQTVVLQINDMIKSLNRRSNASFLADVSAHEASSGMSLVFSMAPGYRELYKCYLMLLHGLSISGDVFHISVKDLALLYEYWCFIKLNSLMKDRYDLVSQNVIKAQGKGLYVSLVKGRGSIVKYRNATSGETITLSYNPMKSDVPTGAQRPDNVLTLKKKGADVDYEYVFDAKYRVNPALPGSDYRATISSQPGPEVSDINTMHRYRDAIVYGKERRPFERTMFGAYVLFPYSLEEEYRQHRFYQSINKVNIGGLPFLPSATRLVTEMLDELISDSPESAFERATLPRGIEEKLAKTDWSSRDVLVGSLKNREQMNACLDHKFYHIPVNKISESSLPIHYIAIYQSIKLFGSEAGVRYYGEVIKCIPVRRREINEIPKSSDEMYYRFEVKSWKKLSKAITPKESARTRDFTNLFLLTHSAEVPELWLRSEEEYRLFMELKRLANDTSINDKDNDLGFTFKDRLIVFENGMIHIYRDKRIIAEYLIGDFTRSPNATFHRIQKDIAEQRVEVAEAVM